MLLCISNFINHIHQLLYLAVESQFKTHHFQECTFPNYVLLIIFHLSLQDVYLAWFRNIWHTTHTHVYVHTYIVYIYVYIRVYKYLYMYVYIYVCIHMYVYIYLYMYVYITYTYICMYIYHIYTYICMYIYTYI